AVLRVGRHRTALLECFSPSALANLASSSCTIRAEEYRKAYRCQLSCWVAAFDPNAGAVQPGQLSDPRTFHAAKQSPAVQLALNESLKMILLRKIPNERIH